MHRNSVSSSNLASVGYDEPTSVLELEFNTGSIYQYFDVPIYVYQELISAGSIGSYFANNIKTSFSCSRV
jgi:KTSC domain